MCVAPSYDYSIHAAHTLCMPVYNIVPSSPMHCLCLHLTTMSPIHQYTLAGDGAAGSK